MLKLKRELCKSAMPEYEVFRDVEALDRTIIICPSGVVIDRNKLGKESTVIRWATEEQEFVRETESICLIVPVRGGSLGALICVANYLTKVRTEIERAIVCTDSGKFTAICGASSNILIRSQTPRTDKLSCEGYRDELSKLFNTDNKSGESCSGTMNMSIEYKAFMAMFGGSMRNKVYPILNDIGGFDPNWLSLKRNGIGASEALRLYENGERGCPMSVKMIEKIPGTLEFCITNMLSTLLMKLGYEVSFSLVPEPRLSRPSKVPSYGRSVKLRDFYRMTDIGQVEGNLHLLGNIMPDARQNNKMVIGLKAAKLCEGYAALVVTEKCLLDQGNLRRLRNLRGYIHLLCTCVRLQNELEAEDVPATVVKLGTTRNVVCSAFACHTIGGKIYGNNARMVKIRENTSVTKDHRKWSDTIGERASNLLSIDVNFGNWVLFTILVQVEHKYEYVIVKQNDVDESNATVDRCLDFDLVRYEKGDFILSLQGATKLLEFFQVYSTISVPTLSWEFMIEVAEVECVLKGSSPV